LLLKMCSRLCDSRRQSIRRLAIAAIALTTCLVGCASFEYLTHVSDTFPQAKACGKCHIDIYEEWSQSDHAGAYTNPHFQAATNDYAFGDCLSCHVPQARLTAGTPESRSGKREEGITCVSCHLEEGMLSGPLEPTGKVHPHPIGVRPEVYRNSDICGRCHEGTMQQWKSVETEKNTCQECHMESITRKVTQATGGVSNVLVAMEKEVSQRRHGFHILNDTQPPGLITLIAMRSGSTVEVRIENHLPHDLPTGDFGFRILTLEIFALDTSGNSVPIKTLELARELGTSIPPHGTRVWSVDVDGDVQAVRTVLTRRSYDQDTLVLARSEMGEARR